MGDFCYLVIEIKLKNSFLKTIYVSSIEINASRKKKKNKNKIKVNDKI